MTAAWVAASIRGRAIRARGAGREIAGLVAAAPSWEEGRAILADTAVGRRLSPDATRAAARDAAVETTVWQLRVLAGWFPPVRTGLVRLAVGPVEIRNIEHHLVAPGRDGVGAPVPLGSLAGVWPRVATTRSPSEVRAILRRSVWGDPGGDDPIALGVGLRISWLRRVAVASETARGWSRAALGVVAARERFVFDRDVVGAPRRTLDHTLGRRWGTAPDLVSYVEALPATLRWPFAGIETAADVWRAELAVIRRVAEKAGRRVAGGGADEATATTVLAALLTDLWYLSAAIEAAGTAEAAEEVFGALAA